jgi:hypothetical protein
MTEIKQVGKFVLLYEPLQRMYRISDGFDLSFWFDNHTKDDLMKLSDFKFTKKCEELIINSLLEF